MSSWTLLWPGMKPRFITIYRFSQNTNFKTSISAKKIMASLFWDRTGILLADFMPQGKTSTVDAYCETLRRLQRAIQNKRSGMLTHDCLLHDKARSHTVHITSMLLDSSKWYVFDHPPHSLGLAPSDFSLVTTPEETPGREKVQQRCWGERRGSKYRWQTFITQGYKSWFLDLISAWTMVVIMSKIKIYVCNFSVTDLYKNILFKF